MNSFLLPAFILLSFASCKTTNNHLSSATKEKSIYPILTALNKNSHDRKAANELPAAYIQLQKEHLTKINTYKNNTNINRWDNIFDEYRILQTAYAAISQSVVASHWVTAINYKNNIDSVKQQAAQEYYAMANTLLQSKKRENAKKAYTYLKIVEYWVPGYKDSRIKMGEAYTDAVINVIINPIQGDSLLNNNDINYSFYKNYNNVFQQTLVKELGDKSSSNYTAKFYTDLEAKQNNIEADWVIDLTLRDIKIPNPNTDKYNYTSSSQIEEGLMDTFTRQRKFYTIISANVNIVQKFFRANGVMDVIIKDAISGNSISRDTCKVEYPWYDLNVSYSGDIEALTTKDWELINKNTFKELPANEIVLAELYNNIYPVVKNRIIYSLGW